MKKIILTLGVLALLASCKNDNKEEKISTDLIENPNTASGENVDEIGRASCRERV